MLGVEIHASTCASVRASVRAFSPSPTMSRTSYDRYLVPSEQLI